MQRLETSSYKSSNTHFRLVHDNICDNVNELIPDTNGKGGAKGSSKSGGDDPGQKDSSGGSFMRSFFVFIFVIGAISVTAGLAWTHCVTAEQQQMIVEKASPLLGVLGIAFEMCLGAIVEAYDWIRAKIRNLPFVKSDDDQEIRGYYEALSGSNGLDLDPEDHNSPQVFPGSQP